MGFFIWHPPIKLGSPGCSSSPIVVVGILSFLGWRSLTAGLQTKSEIRKTALATRDAMPEAQRAQHGSKLIGFAPELDVQAGQVVSGFFPIRSEIDVRPLMSALETQGAHLCLPVVMDKTTIEFRQFAPGAELVKTGFGTFGPSEKAAVLDPDVMLIPLAAFDSLGNRIGYGAGFYDRAITKLHKAGRSPRLIGVAFDRQRVDWVPAEKHDVRLHTILTEDGLHSFPSGG